MQTRCTKDEIWLVDEHVPHECGSYKNNNVPYQMQTKCTKDEIWHGIFENEEKLNRCRVIDTVPLSFSSSRKGIVVV